MSPNISENEGVLDKLHKDPLSITTEDARRLSENYEARDQRSANIISAVESLAVASQDVHEQIPTLGQSTHTSLLTVVHDLKAAVEANTKGVTPEILKITQGVVSKMQRAIGQFNAPHPELEAELQQEIARIEPKIEQGTVTKAEADHLHSLEARAHGHTEKGGVTAHAQSVAAKRERALSLSGDYTKNFQVLPFTANKEPATREQAAREKAANRKMAELNIGTKTNRRPNIIAEEDAAHGHGKGVDFVGEAMQMADENVTVGAN